MNNDDLEGCGPAMRDLTPMQRKFVLTLLMQPHRDTKAAAIAAGYSNGGEGAKVMGFRLVRNDKVIAALQEETRKQMDGSGLAASQVLIQIMSDKSLEPKERRAAATALLDRTGFGVQ